MEVLKTEHPGFCFGVRRAINMVLEAREKTEGNIFTLGPIIHNPQMVEELRRRGIIPVDDVHGIKDGTIVFRTHGICEEEEEDIKLKGLNSIDATCPFVRRVRKKAKFLQKNGYKVVIVGDKNHPEVKSVLSYLHNDGIVLQKPTPVIAKKVGVVSQTTQDKETFFNIICGLAEGAEELRIYNTICESTWIRQNEVALLASKVDAVLIAGGKNSSNTTKLYNIAKNIQSRTYHIETEDDINPEWFSGLKSVGITGGASTPDDILNNVERYVKNL